MKYLCIKTYRRKNKLSDGQSIFIKDKHYNSNSYAYGADNLLFITDEFGVSRRIFGFKNNKDIHYIGFGDFIENLDQYLISVVDLREQKIKLIYGD